MGGTADNDATKERFHFIHRCQSTGSSNGNRLKGHKEHKWGAYKNNIFEVRIIFFFAVHHLAICPNQIELSTNKHNMYFVCFNSELHDTI